MCKILSEKLKKLSSEVIPSNTTKSEYYIIGCIKVRVSDHMSVNSDSDLDVFYNGKSTFVVIPMIGIFKQIQWFTSANEVIDFIVKFEEIAKLLVKRHDIVDKVITEEESVEKKEEKENIITEYAKWKHTFQCFYKIGIGNMGDRMDLLFHNNNPEIEHTLRHNGWMSSVQKVALVGGLIEKFCITKR